ncbi:MAG: hypothetical protein ABR540_08580 [Acidimicrobiales bacterium]
MSVEGEAAALIELRRARWRDARRVGVVGARTMNEEALGKQLSSGRRRRRLHRARAVYPPGALRLYCLVAFNVMSLGMLPSWVGRTEDDVAAIAAWSLYPRDQWPRFRYQLGRFVRVTWPGFIAVTVVLAIWPALQWWFIGALVMAFLPLLWPAGMELREGRQTRVLREAQEEVLASATGPVYWAAGLISGNRGAGAATVRALVAEADAQGITLMGRTEAGPLSRMYEGAGFVEVASAQAWWGQVVLMVRYPPVPATVAAKESGPSWLTPPRRRVHRRLRWASPLTGQPLSRPCP